MAVTHQGGEFSICLTPVDPSTALTEADFDALVYQPVGNVVTAPEFRFESNILTQNTLDSDIGQKQIGFRNAVDTEVVISFEENGEGFDEIEAAAKTKLYYAVKYELDNMPDGGTNGTTQYAVAVLGGGGLAGGGGEDFVNATYQLGLSHQFPIRKAAA